MSTEVEEFLQFTLGCKMDIESVREWRARFRALGPLQRHAAVDKRFVNFAVDNAEALRPIFDALNKEIEEEQQARMKAARAAMEEEWEFLKKAHPYVISPQE